jgi:hypothetical protein
VIGVEALVYPSEISYLMPTSSPSAQPGMSGQIFTSYPSRR